MPSNLSKLKSKVDNLDVDKLAPAPLDISKLSDTVINYAAKKDVYNAKVKNIEDKILDITKLATNTILNAKINEALCEIPNISNLTTTAALNDEINETKGKISSITNLGTTTALPTIKYKIPNVSNLVKKHKTITKKLVKFK